MADEESTSGAGPEPALNGDAQAPVADAPAPDTEPEPASPTNGEDAATVEAEPVSAEGESEVVAVKDESGTEAPAEPEPEGEPEPVAVQAEPEGEPEPEAGGEPAAPEALIPEKAPKADEGPDPLDDLLLAVERLNVRVDELTRLSQRHMEHIDRLHAENQQLRAGELRQAMSPVLRALIRHHDDVAKLASTAEAGSSEAAALGMVRTSLLSALNLAGVDAFEVSAKEKFDPSRHQGVSRAETDDADLDATVAQMRRCGFVGDDGRVIRPAEVDVYRLR
ncbi:MAG: nucleotide exchange factor GrpE [Acidimicrobiales bacterium]